MGFVLGFFLSGRLARGRMSKVHKRMENSHAEQEFLAQRLELTSEQISEFKPLFDSMLPLQNNLRKTHRTEMRKERNAMFSELRIHLTKDQKKLLRGLRNGPKGQRPPPPMH